MKRLARWLRLVVTCLAFVMSTPSPALAFETLGRVVLVVEDEAREEAKVDLASTDVPAISAVEAIVPAFDSPRLVLRRWLANCALLL